MKTYTYPDPGTWKQLCTRPEIGLEFLESAVKNILNRVRSSGDHALIELASQYDQVVLDELRVSQAEISAAEQRISPELKNALRQAASNIEKFHEIQRTVPQRVETQPGVVCWRKAVPIEKVGIYIPGGSAPLFSTVLMLGLPARLAGCKEVVVCTPPGKDGKINDAILYAAKLVGATTVFKVGGAQAIAALAYGTETIPAVHKIFGPGNQYVTKAKQLVNLQGTAIDLPAGPSEVLVVADKNADAEFVAADLLSQAEHGADSQVVFVTCDEAKLSEVQRALAIQVERLPRKDIAQLALANSLALLFKTDDEVAAFVNAYAPEHLILNMTNCEAFSEQIINAGSIFLGAYSPEAAGDYASGTNHTLPTNGFAKAYGGVSLESFTKYITFQQLTADGLKILGPAVEVMAAAEQLDGHKEAITIRLKKIK